MKLKLLVDGTAEFRCDACDKVLDAVDPGEVYFPDHAWFLDHVEEAGPDSCWFLCVRCFAEHHGQEQPGYDNRWKSLEPEPDRS